MYGYGFHIGCVFPEKIFKVISMYGHNFYIGKMFPEKRLAGFLECMGMIGVLDMCFQKKIVRVFRMYEHDCHIGHVFPEKVVAFMGMIGI